MYFLDNTCSLARVHGNASSDEPTKDQMDSDGSRVAHTHRIVGYHAHGVTHLTPPPIILPRFHQTSTRNPRTVRPCATMKLLALLATASLSLAGTFPPEKLQNLSVTVHAAGAQGSGVIITRNGVNYVLTAGHVVDDARTVTKLLDNTTGENKRKSRFEPVRVVREIIREGRSIGKTTIEAEVVAYSSSEYGDDLALLRLRDPITTESVVFYNDTAIPSTGTRINHVGSFLGQEGSNSFSEGQISQIGRTLYDHVFDQGNSAAFPGSSGGGIWKAETGEYIGTLVRGAGETYNLFVPIRRIKEWAKRHNIEFIFDESAKPDDSKIILEGLEPDPEPGSRRYENKLKTFLYREEEQKSEK